jgi:hypothetical protein
MLGGATAGVVELFGFHPVDTVAKRLMAHDGAVRLPGMPFQTAVDGYARVVLRDAYDNPSAFARYKSLFPGLSFAAAYKILQRVYKFGGQPIATDFMTTRFGAAAERMTGGDKAKAKQLLHATAGAAIGVGEVCSRSTCSRSKAKITQLQWQAAAFSRSSARKVSPACTEARAGPPREMHLDLSPCSVRPHL